MTARSKTALKALFENGDQPDADAFGDLIDSFALFGALSDAPNVIIVDSDGNGDYTTIVAAMTAITDATANNRYTVLIVGETTESGDIICKDYVDIHGFNHKINTTAGNVFYPATAKYHNLTIEDIHSAGADTAYFYNCNFNSLTITHNVAWYLFQCVSSTNSGTITIDIDDGELWLYDCQISTNTKAVDITDAIVHIQNSKIQGASENVIYLNHASAELYMHNSKVSGLPADAAKALCYINNAATCHIHGSHFTITFSNGDGLYAATQPGDFIAISSYFKAPSDDAVAAAAAWNNAPFYHCVFEGGTTNITADAGTANGSNIEI